MAGNKRFVHAEKRMHGDAPEARKRVTLRFDGGKEGGIVRAGARFFVQHVFQPFADIREGGKRCARLPAQCIQDRIGKVHGAFGRMERHDRGLDFCGDLRRRGAAQQKHIAAFGGFTQGGSARKAGFGTGARSIVRCARAGDGNGRNARRNACERPQIFDCKDVVGRGKRFRIPGIGCNFRIGARAGGRKGKPLLEIKCNSAFGRVRIRSSGGGKGH